MNTRFLLLVLGSLLLLGWTPLATCAGAAADEHVEIAVESAPVKVGSKTIATMEQGRRFRVLRRFEGWVAIEWETDQRKKRGWVRAWHVKTVPLAGAKETAPEEPQIIDWSANWTQMSSYGSPPRLYFELTLTNPTDRPLSYDVKNFQFLEDGKPIPKPTPIPRSHSSIMVAGSNQSESNLTFLNSGEIAPGASKTGWVKFVMPRTMQAAEISKKKWAVSAKVGGETVKFQLSDREKADLDLRVRPAHLDKSIQVLEVNSPINSLNVGKFTEILQSLKSKREGAIILMNSGRGVVDRLAMSEVQRQGFMGGGLAVDPFGRAVGTNNTLIWVSGSSSSSRYRTFGGYYPNSRGASEGAAVVQLLSRRPDGHRRLIGLLTNQPLATRQSAASMLGNHLEKPGVRKGLLRLVTDKQANLRSAALRSLSRSAVKDESLRAVLAAAKDKHPSVRVAAISALTKVADPQATKAVVNALSDENYSVRAAAASAAANHPAEKVVDPLIKVLDDSQYSVVSAACRALKTHRAKKAIPQLKKILAHGNQNSKREAATTLESLGAISAAAATMARLETGYSSSSEFRKLVQSKDPQVGTFLLRLLENQQNSYISDQAAKALADLGDKRAIEPLLNKMKYSGRHSTNVVYALGKLGDKRAIEPLHAALSRYGSSSSTKNAIYQALLQLGDKDVFDRLAEDLKKPSNSSSHGRLLQTLAKAGDKAVPTIVPYLDHDRHYRYAALALAEIGSAKAMAPLKKRILSKDYKHAASVISNMRSQKSAGALELVHAAMKSEQEAVRTQANSAVTYLLQRRTSEQRSRLYQFLRAKDQAGAEDAMVEAVREWLSLIESSPAAVGQFSQQTSSLLSSFERYGMPAPPAQRWGKLLAQWEAKAKQAMASDSPQSAIQRAVSQLRAFYALSLSKEGRGQQAATIIRKEIKSAKKQWTEHPEDIALAAHLTGLLKQQYELLGEFSPERQQSAQQEYLKFLQQRLGPKKGMGAKDAAAKDYVVAISTIGRKLAYSNTEEAERFLQSIERFLGQWNTQPEAVASHVAQVERMIVQLQSYIDQGRIRLAAEQRATESVRRRGGEYVATGYKASFSPDGNFLVCGRVPVGRGLQIVNLQTGSSRRLAGLGKDPAWSPSPEPNWAGRIVFVRGNTTGEQIWLLEFDPRQLTVERKIAFTTHKLADGGFPTWSRDGKTIYFQSRKKKAVMALDLPPRPDKQDSPSSLTARGQAQPYSSLTEREVLKNIAGYYTAVSPDGKRIAYQQGTEIRVVESQSGKTLHTWRAPSSSVGFLPGWSPDSKQILFGGYALLRDDYGVMYLDPQTGDTRQLVGAPFTMPAWSRDGQTLALDVRSASGTHEIWTIDAKAIGVKLSDEE